MSKSIAIKNICVDIRIADIVRKNYGNLSDFKNICWSSALPLSQSRLESCKKGLLSNSVPPIDVQLVDGKYKILNGRHRVAAAILLRLDHIDAKISK